ncbi:signal peptidase I, partial [Pseudomonas aeruginosa]|nr:signal peptidase I [Pseudomonas aeruginosa]
MGLLAAIMLAVYLANPFGTASLDPRARLLGVALYKIPSRSMEPTLQQGDFILANAARYAFAAPQVGARVVFRVPPPRRLGYGQRIAGLPGARGGLGGGRRGG